MKLWVKIFISVFLVIFSAVFVLFYLTRAELYSKLGSYYTKNNDYISAQKYYDMSYSLGNKNKDFRENYVNFLINSPLTIKAQERLVNIAEDGSRDTASESAKYFLYNLRREIHNKYPDNYVQQAAYGQKIVHWGKIPITYTIKQKKGVPSEVIQAVNDAFDSWERASSARIRFERIPRNADIIVSFTNFKILNPKVGEKYVIAYTVPDISSNRLNKMDLILNVSNIDGTMFTPDQIYNTTLHEIFHALGFMGHSFEKENVMYVAQSNELFAGNGRRKISDADKSTLELFYKVRPDITNAQELSYEYIPYSIIGDNADINYAKEEEARKYISKAPKLPSGYVDLAQALINQKNYDGAIDNLQKALYLSKNDETKFLALYNLSVANYFGKVYELALFYADKAIEIKNDDSVHVLKAEIYKKNNDKNNAIKEYEYLLRRNPDNEEYIVNLVNIYISKKNYLKARSVLKSYITRNPHQKNNPRFKPCRLLLL